MSVHWYGKIKRVISRTFERASIFLMQFIRRNSLRNVESSNERYWLTYFKKNATTIFLIVIVGCNFFFSFQRIGQFTGGDETLWSYQRVPNFWNAVASHKWKKTNISDKPGITLVLLAGIGLPFADDPKVLDDLFYSSKTPAQLNSIETLYRALRFPILFFSLVSLFVFFILIKKLLGVKIALLSTVFIGLSPILVGMSIYINSDALLWIFIPLTLLSFLVYQKLASRRYLFLSGIFLGLALLTKYVSVILFPFVLILIFLQAIFSQDTIDSIRYFKKSLTDYAILLATSIAVIFVLFPATWVKPKIVLDLTLMSQPFRAMAPIFLVIVFFFLLDGFLLKNRLLQKISVFVIRYRMFLIKIVSFIAISLILFTVINTYSGMKFVDFPSVLTDPRIDANLSAIQNEKIISNILTAFYSLIFGLTPVVVLFFIFTLLLLVLKCKKYTPLIERNYPLLIAFYLILFILIYYGASSLLGVTPIVRYQVALYPLAAIIAAIGFMYALQWNRVKPYFKGSGFYVLVSLLILFSVNSLWLAKPFYLEYSSSFFPREYILNADNSGDASWELAQYLNSLPDANNLYIWTDIRQVCEKFIGKCAFGLKSWSASDVSFDYFVIPLIEQNRERSFKNNSDKIKIGSSLLDTTELYAPDRNYVFKVIIDGREPSIIKIVKNAQNK